MKEYKLSKGWMIVMCFASPLLIGLFGWLLVFPFTPFMRAGESPIFFLFFAPISLAMIFISIVGLRDAIKGSFLISDNDIAINSTLVKRRLMFTEIAGFRVDDKYISVQPSVKGKKRIKISRYFGNSDEIIQWLSSRYPDFDQVNAELERQEILKNEAFGWNEAQREHRLKNAQKIGWALNGAGILVGVWAFLFPRFYEYMVLVSICLPVIATLALRFSGGMLRIDQRKDSAYPTILWGLVIPAVMLALRTLIDYSIFNYEHLWKPMIGVMMLSVIVIVVGNEEFNFRKIRTYSLLIGLLVMMACYGYGSVIQLNCLYDNATSKEYTTAVIGKRISHGKTTTYYLKLSPWGPQKEEDEVSVSKLLYDDVNDHETIYVYFMPGRFGIPWFEVAK